MPKLELKKKFICPISHELVVDPVVCADGYTYDRASIEKWFGKGKRTSPMTNDPLPTLDLFPNHSLKSDLKEFLSENKVCSEKEFLEAIKSGDVEKVKKLNYLEHYLDIHDPSPDVNKFTHNTPLHFAAILNSVPLIEFLLSEGANTHAVNHNGEVPMRSAARCGCLDAVRILHDRSGDVEALNSENCSALSNACYNGYLDVVKYLVGKGADLENRNKSAIRPIMWAAMQGRADIIRYLLLLQPRPDLRAKDRDGDTALHFAVKYKREKVVEILVGHVAGHLVVHVGGGNQHQHQHQHQHGHGHGGHVVPLLDEPNNQLETPLICAINLDELAGGAANGTNGNTNANANGNGNGNGNGAGHVSVARTIVRVLLKAGASVNARDKNGNTPLMLAAKRGKDQILSDLLAHYNGNGNGNGNGQRNNLPDLDAKDPAGETTLTWAIKSNKIGVTKMLIGAGADFSTVRDAAGFSAFHLAAKAGLVECVAMMLQTPRGSKMDVDDKTTSTGWTALHLAAAAGNKDLITLLMKSGANHHICAGLNNNNNNNNNNESAVDLAHTNRHGEAAEYILELSQQLKRERVKLVQRVEGLEKQVTNQNNEIKGLEKQITNQNNEIKKLQDMVQFLMSKNK